MVKDKVIKIAAASLNIIDPFQKKLWDHANKHTNVSAYIKGLIQRDMESNMPTPLTVPAHKEKEEINDDSFMGLL
jgi:hypothetical protein